MTKPRIQLLPPLVAERIAAGEVIERPGSVVKELIENSLDAGATEIAVKLEDGGKTLIEVLDNGYGMNAEDLALCVKRHATSKLRSLDDLEKISTMGFRGEALPSVAAAAELSIISRSKDSDDRASAYELQPNRATPQAVTFGHFLGTPHGTRIQAAGLFSQIPARLKFLKSTAAEVSFVREWMERLALTHPNVGFKLQSNERIVLNLRPETEGARVRTILGEGDDTPLVTTEKTTDFGRIRVHWLQGMSVPQTRKLVQAVNRRAVRDRMLQQAVMTSFRQTLLPGQFPAVALFIEIDPALIDVNVHPTKTELRFLNSGDIFKSVESCISGLIHERGFTAFASAPVSAPATNPITIPASAPPFRPTFRAAEPFTQPAFELPLPQARLQTSEQTTETLDIRWPELAASFTPERYIGNVFQTYLLFDLGTELGLIDQHAAHERVRYEALRRALLNGNTRQQQLLIPEAVIIQPESRQKLEQRLTALSTAGFDAEIFGETSVLFRAVPAEWGTDSLRVRLKNLVERVIADETNSWTVIDEHLFETIASEACRSSVMAGDRITATQALALVSDLLACEHPWNCPHGRPTIARIPQLRFEEWFRRKL